MKNLNRNTLVRDFLGAAFCLFMAFALLMMYSGCSENTSSPVNVVEGGAAEEQGVYALAGRVLGVDASSSESSPSIDSKIWAGYMLRMVELDSVTFDTTENIYFSSYTDALGVFSFDSVRVKSPYVLLELSPVYRKNWWASLDTLVELGMEYLIDFTERFMYRTIVNLRETEFVEVNLMTSLETLRLRNLIKQGQSYKTAKLQAGRDVMNAFGFYDEPFLFGNREYADSKASEDVLGFASTYIETNYACLEKEDIAGFGISGTFANSADSVKTKCLKYPAAILWSEKYIDEHSLKDVTDKERIVFGNFVSSLYGVGKCNEEKEGDSLVITYLSSELDFKIKCESGNWLGSVFRTVMDDMPRTEGTMTDPRDGKIYRTVTYKTEAGTQTWMMENLVYSGEGVTAILDSATIESAKAYREEELRIQRVYHGPFASPNDSLIWLDSLKNARGDWIYYVDSTYWNSYVKYKWFEALGLDSVLVYTDSGSINSEKVFAILDSIEAANGYYQGLCPDGWRIPKIEDWNNLFKQAYRAIGRVVENGNSDWAMGGAFELPRLGFGPMAAGQFIVRPEAETENMWVLKFAVNLKMGWLGAFELDKGLNGEVNIRCIKN
jgi:uncharacterized protein (TIGR02145 family)